MEYSYDSVLRPTFIGGYTYAKDEVEPRYYDDRARCYDPGTGRWLSQEPLGFEPGDSNLYRYDDKARVYDPGSGRWLSQDPLGFDAGDSNLYRYVNNSPVDATDPSGLQIVPNAAEIKYFTKDRADSLGKIGKLGSDLVPDYKLSDETDRQSKQISYPDGKIKGVAYFSKSASLSFTVGGTTEDSYPNKNGVAVRFDFDPNVLKALKAAGYPTNPDVGIDKFPGQLPIQFVQFVSLTYQRYDEKRHRFNSCANSCQRGSSKRNLHFQSTGR